MKFFATATLVLAFSAIAIGVWVGAQETPLPEVGALVSYDDSDYIFIFSPDCPHCVASFPAIQHISDAGYSVAALCVTCGDTWQAMAAKQFMRENSLTSVPITLRIDGGKIVWMWIGALDSSNFQIQGEQ